MGRATRWVITLVVMVASYGALGVAAPAWACGCGAYIPDRPGPTVVTERALVAWDGTTEDIAMSFDVDGASRAAAWVMPVPSAAEVTLGDEALFRAVDVITAPRVEYRSNWWPSLDFPALGFASRAETSAAAPSGVRVLGQQRIGPFDVARLSAGDAKALAAWLGDNGFPRPDGLERNLGPYVADGWELVAIKLVAADAADELGGGLQPLTLSFATDVAVYPMRLSRSASVPQTVEIAVLADHRMDPTNIPSSGAAPVLEYAGRITSIGDADPALRPFLAKGTYLTQWSNRIDDPSSIDGDYVFSAAESDLNFQQVVYVTEERGWITRSSSSRRSARPRFSSSLWCCGGTWPVPARGR